MPIFMNQSQTDYLGYKVIDMFEGHALDSILLERMHRALGDIRESLFSRFAIQIPFSFSLCIDQTPIPHIRIIYTYVGENPDPQWRSVQDMPVSDWMEDRAIRSLIDTTCDYTYQFAQENSIANSISSRLTRNNQSVWVADGTPYFTTYPSGNLTISGNTIATGNIII